MDYERLKKEISNRGLTITKVAEALGIDESTFYRKVGSGGGSFSVSQIGTLAELLHLSSTDCVQTFFAD